MLIDPQEKESKITDRLLPLLLVLWVALRLPNLGAELGLRMDAATAATSMFIYESYMEDPASRLFCAVDHREQFDELKTGVMKPYCHVPPLALQPLGIWQVILGNSESSLRGYGIFCSLLFFAFVWLFLRRYRGKTFALWVLLALCFMTQSVHYSRSTDPFNTWMFLAPLLWWLYLRFEDKPSLSRFYTLCGISLLAGLAYWNAYATAGFLALYHFFFGKTEQRKREGVILAVSVFLALPLSVAYFSQVLGGFENFVEDFTGSAKDRTRFNLGYLSLLRLWAFEMTKNFGPVIVIGSFIWTFLPLRDLAIRKRIMPSHLIPYFLFLGGIAFPLYVLRVTIVHYYFNTWMMLPMAMATVLLAERIWKAYPKAGKATILALAFLSVAFSLVVSYRRVLLHDKDYLLSRHMGQALRPLAENAVLLTDIKDNEHVMQYYSNAKILGRAYSVESLNKWIEARKRNSDDTLPVYFVTTLVDKAYSAIPGMKLYPREKLVGEYGLREVPYNDPLWIELERNWQKDELGPYTIFSYYPTSLLGNRPLLRE